jgi:hypothetical protein
MLRVYTSFESQPLAPKYLGNIDDVGAKKSFNTEVTERLSGLRVKS